MEKLNKDLLIQREKLIIENFAKVSKQLGMVINENQQFNSAVDAYKNSQDGDVFEMTVTSAGYRNKNGFTGDDVSKEIVVKQGQYFVPKSDLNINPDAFEYGRKKRREFSPIDLDKNNKTIILVKLK